MATAELVTAPPEPAPSHVSRRVCVCRICERSRPHHAKGLCGSCYSAAHENGRLTTCGGRHAPRPHCAGGWCDSCYRLRRGRRVVCVRCGARRRHHARRHCAPCYEAARRDPTTPWVKTTTCGGKHAPRPHRAGGLCFACDASKRARAGRPTCPGCGGPREKDAARCRACHDATRGVDGRTLKEIAAAHGLRYGTVVGRIKRGWSRRAACTTPLETTPRRPEAWGGPAAPRRTSSGAATAAT